MDGRSGRRESSPERAKMLTTRSTHLQPKVKATTSTSTTRMVQVVYYLSRNGQLEHPHYMELELHHQQLRLRDFTEKLTALRGKVIPALYSWSCKRSYKNGYVWNDLAENDVIYPSDGAEYVLKGSEILGGCSERFQDQLQITAGSRRQVVQDQNVHAGRSSLLPTSATNATTTQLDQPHQPNNYEYQHFSHEEEEEEEEPQEVLELEDEEKTSYSSSTTSRCSRGVSTDELLPFSNQNNPTAPPPPPPPPHPTVVVTNPSPKISNNKKGETSGASKRFEDGDPIEPGAARGNSVLLQLISCGNLVLSTRPKNTVPSSVSPNPNNSNSVAAVRKSSGCGGDRSSDLRKGVLYKVATTGNVNSVSGNKIDGCKVIGVQEKEEDMSMIKYMSENPRFGNLQAEDKEYFSGSIVESMISDDRAVARQPVRLKRSNSYGELARSSKAGLEEEEAAANEEDIKDRAASKAKCIPRNICPLTSSKPVLRK